MSPRLTILADDLTGAADCAVQAVRAGLRAVVLFAAPGSADVPDADVVAFDLDVRNAGDAAAAERIRAAAPAGGTYLKVDSTLRGPIAAMVDAALDAGGSRVAVLAPAFPALGRTTAGGRHRTADGSLDADLGALVRDTRRPVLTLDLATLRAGGASAAGVPDGGVLVCDAETDDDLARIAADLAAEAPLWVGSAGLAAALVAGGAGAEQVGDADDAAPAGHVLTVAGSFAPETVGQVQALLDTPGTSGVGVDPETLAGAAPDAEIDRAAGAVRAALDAGHDPVLHVSTDPEAHASLRGAGGAHVRARSIRIAAGLGRIVSAAALPAGTGLVLTGGETARAVCDALGVPGLTLHGEVAPGVPHGQALGRDLRVVTKAGAFGDADTLTHAVRRLKASA